MSDLSEKLDRLISVVSQLQKQQQEQSSLKESIALQSAQIKLLTQQLAQRSQPAEPLSIKEAARKLSIGESTLRQAIDRGDFKSGTEVIRLNGGNGGYRIFLDVYLARVRREQERKRVC